MRFCRYSNKTKIIVLLLLERGGCQQREHQIVKLFHKDGANRIDLYFSVFSAWNYRWNDLLIIVAVNQMLFIQDGMMQCGKEAAGGLRYEIKHITVKQIEDTVQLCKRRIHPECCSAYHRTDARR